MRDRFRKFLGKLFYQRRVPPALLLYGKRGVGKRDMAFEFASSLLCLEKKYPPCGECQSCLHMQDFRQKKEEELAFYGEDKKGKRVYLYLQGDHPDFVYLKPEKAEIRIDQIRGVKDFVYLKPALSKRKVVLIEPADAMNLQAQNALLKVLEEPPEDTHFLLVANALQKVLPTIKSRSFLLEVPPLSEEELKEKTGIKDPLLIELSEGSLEMAMKLKEDKELIYTAKALLEGDTLTLYKKALEVEKWDYERQTLLLKVIINLLHKKYLETSQEVYQQSLDKASMGLEYLSKGIRLSLLIFQLKGGVNNVLHKGEVSGHQQGASG